MLLGQRCEMAVVRLKAPYWVPYCVSVQCLQAPRLLAVVRCAPHGAVGDAPGRPRHPARASACVDLTNRHARRPVMPPGQFAARLRLCAFLVVCGERAGQRSGLFSPSRNRLRPLNKAFAGCLAGFSTARRLNRQDGFGQRSVRAVARNRPKAFGAAFTFNLHHSIREST